MASKYAQELIPLSTHINGILIILWLASVQVVMSWTLLGFLNYFCSCIKYNALESTANFSFILCLGILDYLEAFNIENLHKVATMPLPIIISGIIGELL